MIASNDKALKMLEKATTEFSRKELAPDREENDKYPFGPFFDTVLNKAYELDFFHTLLPEELNGVGQGVSAFCVILDNICREDSSLAGIIFTNSAAQEIMLSAKSLDALKKNAGVDKVQDFLIAFPVFNNPSEIDHLADAKKVNGNYILSGSVEYVSLGNIASQGLIPAKIQGKEGISFFLIDLSDKNVDKSSPIHSLGLHACPAVDLEIKNVKGVLIGKEGAGNTYFEEMSDKMHVAAAAMSLGIMKGSFKEALEYSQKRFQGGREIIHWSEIKMILATMAIKINNADMTIARACGAIDKKESKWALCSRAAAAHIQEMACDLTTDGIQVLGGVGYMKDFGQEKRFRDAKHVQSLLGIAPMKKIKYIEKMINPHI